MTIVEAHQAVQDARAVLARASAVYRDAIDVELAAGSTYTDIGAELGIRRQSVADAHKRRSSHRRAVASDAEKQTF